MQPWDRLAMVLVWCGVVASFGVIAITVLFL